MLKKILVGLVASLAIASCSPEPETNKAKPAEAIPATPAPTAIPPASPSPAATASPVAPASPAPPAKPEGKGSDK